MKLAYSVREFLNEVPFGKTTFYKEVKRGKLQVHKLGKKTVVKGDEAQRYIESLPAAEELAA
ncbi:MAG: hypothetical protein AAGF54_06075 [Pseudomonadota bacterium]